MGKWHRLVAGCSFDFVDGHIVLLDYVLMMTSTQFFCAGTETESLWRFVWPKLICFCTGRKQCWQHKRSFWPNSAHPKDYFGSHWPESYAQMAGKHVVNCIKDVEHQVQTASKVVLHANNFARQTFFLNVQASLFWFSCGCNYLFVPLRAKIVRT